MELVNRSHLSDEDVLWLFNWVKNALNNEVVIEKLIVKTRKRNNSWRGRWTMFYPAYDVIKLAVSKQAGPNSYERKGIRISLHSWVEYWVAGFAHELTHSTGASEKACVKAERAILQVWRQEFGYEVRSIPR